MVKQLFLFINAYTAITRDPRKMLRVKSGDSKQYIYIYSCAGKLLSKFEVRRQGTQYSQCSGNLQIEEVWFILVSVTKNP